MTPPKNRTPSPRNDIQELAATALAAIEQLARAMPTDPQPARSMSGRTGCTVSDEAMDLAARIVTENAARFPDLEASSIRDALAYEKSLSEIGDRVIAIGERMRLSSQLHRGAAANQTRAVYQMLKGLSTGLASLSKTDRLREHASQMKKLMTTRKTSRATEVTRAEVGAALQKLKAGKVAAARAASAEAAVADATASAREASLASS